MKWSFLFLTIAVSLVDILLISNLKIFGLQISIFWAFCTIVLVNHWVSYRYAILLVLIGGYLIDILTAFKSGGVILALMISSMVSIILLKNLNRKWLGVTKGKMVMLVSLSCYLMVNLLFEWPPLGLELLMKISIYLLSSILVLMILYLSSRGFNNR